MENPSILRLFGYWVLRNEREMNIHEFIQEGKETKQNPTQNRRELRFLMQRKVLRQELLVFERGWKLENPGADFLREYQSVGRRSSWEMEFDKICE